ncbi:vasoactive intestinal polypeptide receptor 1 isoform X1 [Myotis daubentonii]|uniref:vasoactive intestinal polypeptide receptor 1 isoform X1 n=1 Tax=Myotis daubentonii TaxID=98922 RepID=UPI00287356BB|nr:vasoactive intestinal polypeptide receptor 1 isoform X1 [Myotis daubentonii]
MRPRRPLPALRLCLLAGALACALRPASGWDWANVRDMCDYLQMIKTEHRQCLEEAELENQTAGCSKMWDNITCWPATPRGQVVVMACPLIYSLFYPLQGHNVSRRCTDEGWTELEPSPYPIACVTEPFLEEQQNRFYISVKTGYTIGYGLSLTSLLVAMAILSLFRKLHCTRNYIHMHLFMSFILRAASVFIKDLILFNSSPSEDCSESWVGCKAAVVLFQYCVMTNFFWLLVEGLYLHTLLVVSFFSERKYFWGYMLIGWGVPSTFTMVWTITKIYLEDYGCWDTIGTSRLWWILKAPVLTSILVNFMLFIRIIRILVQKLQTPNVGKSDKSPYSVTKSHVALAHLYPMAWLSPQVSSAPAPPVQAHESHVCFSCSLLPWQVIGPRRLAKSTLLLIPLFGIHYTVFAFFPDNFNAEVKMIFDLVVGSFQGFLVAVLYCFLNGEVQAELRRKWRRWDLQGVLGLGPKYQHPPGGSSSNGVTCSTQVSLLTRVSPGARRSSSFQAEDSVV